MAIYLLSNKTPSPLSQHFKSFSSLHLRKAKPMLILVLLRALSCSPFARRPSSVQREIYLLHVNLSCSLTSFPHHTRDKVAGATFHYSHMIKKKHPDRSSI